MTSPTDTMHIIWPIFVILSCAISWTAQEILYRKIKERYFDKWVDIGEPGFKTMLSNDLSKFKKAQLTYKYLIKGDSDLDKDKEIKKLRRLNQVIFVAILLCMALFIISSIIFNFA